MVLQHLGGILVPGVDDDVRAELAGQLELLVGDVDRGDRAAEDLGVLQGKMAQACENERMRNRDGSILSIGSSGSILSIGSAGSILSIGSAGSILSIGSAGSIASVLSVGSAASIGSVLSALSNWSLLAWRGRPGGTTS
jgi:hypothetical protein